MGNKINKWGNSHGIRLSTMMLKHLNAVDGDQLELQLTNNGIEIIKKNKRLSSYKADKKWLINDLIQLTSPVQNVLDPSKDNQISYILIDINPHQPIIRETKKSTLNQITPIKTYKTLNDAKFAARKLIQQTVEKSQSSLVDIRQIGVEKIKYLKL